MIELSTGVVFLMSSLYGSGHAKAQIATAAQAMNEGTTVRKTEIIETASLKTNSDVTNENRYMNSVEAYIRKEFADTPILIEIARCESGFNQFNNGDRDVLRGNENRYDVGAFQINEKYHLQTSETLGIDIYTLQGNAAFAKYLYKRYGSSPWVHSSKCWGPHDLAKK